VVDFVTRTSSCSYAHLMTPALRSGLATLLLGSSVLFGAGAATAEPLPPCAYELTPPAVIQGDAGPMVAVSVSPTACGFPASPYVSVACVGILGEGTSCTQNPETAQITMPYRPGATYVGTGRGCGSFVGRTVTQDCQLFGPVEVTL
jgi:hypothetical protein